MHTVFGLAKSQSHNLLPISSNFKHADAHIKALEEELAAERLYSAKLKEKCDSLTNSVWTLEHTLMMGHQLIIEHKLANSVGALNVEMQLASEMEMASRKVTIGIETLMNELDITEVYAQDDVEDESREGSESGDELKKESGDEFKKESGENWYRRPSGSSSYLYAGVEQPTSVYPLSSAYASPPIKSLSCNAQVETNTLSSPSSANFILPSLTLLLKGSWLYKYPRRNYTKLITQPTIPTSQLSYRYFWLNPLQSSLSWSATPWGEGKKVKVLDYYTERRSVSEGERATVVVVLTEEGPLGLVPATNEDLAMWMDGLGALLRMKRDQNWPENLAICSL